MLSFQYVYHDDRTETAPVLIKESRGHVVYELHRGLFLPEGIAALNAASHQFLAGGQWFQLWRGEVISMASPERRGTDFARVH
ncbi:hypothetical protein [Streptomyces sp. NPDC001404]|uniref:hypothetical protein n=1 Tax=Streptomyces sp. NPDC001404 TaxID=3364571 RepID=UPI0036B584C2